MIYRYYHGPRYLHTGPRESYVYTLSKPDGTVFYVGQGQKRRIMSHEAEARAGKQSLKCDIIRQIWASGGEVIRTKVQCDLTYGEALELEGELILKYKPVGNMPGHNRSKVTIPVPTVKGDLARRLRHHASIKLGYQLSEQEMINLTQSLLEQAIDAYCGS